MKVVIIGATGLVGSHVLKTLNDNNDIQKITILSRKSIEIESQKTELVLMSDMTSEKINNAKLEGDIFICALGTTIKKAKTKEMFHFVDYELVLAFANLALNKKCRKFYLVSALGAKCNSIFYYNRVKGQIEEAISKLELPEFVILRPSLLIGKREERRNLEKSAIIFYKLLNGIVPKKFLKRLGTEVDDIAHFVDLDIKRESTQRVRIITDFQ